MINHIATRYSQIKKNKNTLFFHLNSRYRLKRLRKYKNLVIVTEKSTIFKTAQLSHLVIKVRNIQAAYWDLICHYRESFQIPVFGITGTSGKTTTKEMITQVLTMEGLNVQSTYRSNNGPSRDLHYLLEITDQTDASVIEMGLAKPGDLQKTCRVFQPNIRILLNIGVYHLEGCETMENYIKAKAEILEGIKPEDILILNADDPNIKKIDISHVTQKIYIGINEKADFMAKNIHYTDLGISFKLVHKGVEYQAIIPGYGRHNVYNALASIAAVYQIGIEIEKSINNLSKFRHLDSHLEPFSGVNGCSIIDDTWNNTPPAMEAALNVLKEISNGKKNIAVLGYFPRLGESNMAKQQYEYIAAKVIETGVDKLILTDEKSIEIGKHAIKMGMSHEDIHYCFTDQDVSEAVAPLLTPETIVLLKFSRIRRDSLFNTLKETLIS